MTTPDDTSIPRIAPMFRFQWEPVQSAHVLLYPEGVVQLSGSAGEILKRVDGTRSVAEIIAELRVAFAGADLDDDVRRFLTEAAARGWIHT